jgi:hypothetical protein
VAAASGGARWYRRRSRRRYTREMVLGGFMVWSSMLQCVEGAGEGRGEVSNGG